MRRLAPTLFLLPLLAACSAPEIPKEPNDWHWIQRTAPYFEYDVNAYRDAIDQKAALSAARKGATGGSWETLGPDVVGGRVVDLALHPERPQDLYAAAATGGVFHSPDLGRTWEPLFDDQPILTIGDIAIAPSNPDILYVGTGEANGGHNNYPGGGVYRSDDAGASWRPIGLEGTVSTGRIIIHPNDPDRAWVAAVGYFAPNPERGVYRTSDGGGTWEQVLAVNDSTGIVDLVARPDDPDVLFAAAWERRRRVSGSRLYGGSSGVYRSTDGGDSWSRLGPDRGLPDPADHIDSAGNVRMGRIGLAVAPSRPETVYAWHTDGSSVLGLYRSDDGGDSWRETDPDGSIDRVGSSNRFSFSWFFGQVRVAPDDPDEVFVLDVDIYRSANGGDGWSAQRGTHVDHHALLFHPDNPDLVFDGNDGGVAISSDGGATWSKATPLPITQVYEIALDPTQPTRLFLGSQDNGTWMSDSGTPTDWKKILSGDGFYALPIPGDATRAYASAQRGAMYRVDGLFGNPVALPVYAGTGIPETERRNWSTPIVMDPFDPGVIYYGTYRVWRTVDGVQTPWQPISPDMTTGTQYERLGTLTSIAVSPLDNNVIWAATDDGHVWVSRDWGETWTDRSQGLPFRWVTRVVADPVDDANAYLTFSGLKWRDPVPHVFRTTDFGATWENITADLPDAPANALAVDPLDTDRIFVGTDIGLFASLDGGGSWEPLEDGMPAVVVADLKIDSFGRRLVAGTHGRGMYAFDLSQLDIATQVERPRRPLAAGTPYPNPSSEAVTIPVLPSTLSVEIFDVRGRRVAVPTVAGTVVRWDGRDGGGERVAAGTYFVRTLTRDGGVATTTMVRAR